MKTKITIGILVVFLIGAGAIIYADRGASSPSPVAASPQSAASSTPAKTYTLADIAAHNGASSCWTAINGKVYDVTSWISQHPGGPEHILDICGTDGSDAFNGQHSGESGPAQALAGFYIGDLAQ